MPAALFDKSPAPPSSPGPEHMSFLPFPRQRIDDTQQSEIGVTHAPDHPDPLGQGLGSDSLDSIRAKPLGHDSKTTLSTEATWTLKNLDYLIEAWPLLIELRIPGTRPRWTERSHRILGAPGENVKELRNPSGGTSSSPTAPTNVSLLDLLATIASVADDVSRAISDVLEIDEASRLPSAWLDPRPHFGFVRAGALTADALDPRTMPWLFEQLTTLVISVSATLGEARHGQILAALCPWCGGRSPAAPTGGDRTLVLRRPDPANPDLNSARIICTGTDCSPPISACTDRDPNGRPAWPWREWDWLATQILPLPTKQK